MTGDDASSGSGPGSASVSTTQMTASADGTSTTDGTKFDLGIGPDAGPTGCGGNGGKGHTQYSYIWIANSSQGTVSKINTETGVEEGRYYSSPMQGTGNSLAHLGQPARRRRGE